jgi:hypothetical protein
MWHGGFQLHANDIATSRRTLELAIANLAIAFKKGKAYAGLIVADVA